MAGGIQASPRCMLFNTGAPRHHSSDNSPDGPLAADTLPLSQTAACGLGTLLRRSQASSVGEGGRCRSLPCKPSCAPQKHTQHHSRRILRLGCALVRAACKIHRLRHRYHGKHTAAAFASRHVCMQKAAYRVMQEGASSLTCRLGVLRSGQGRGLTARLGGSTSARRALRRCTSASLACACMRLPTTLW